MQILVWEVIIEDQNLKDEFFQLGLELFGSYIMWLDLKALIILFLVVKIIRPW